MGVGAEGEEGKEEEGARGRTKNGMEENVRRVKENMNGVGTKMEGRNEKQQEIWM